MTEGQFWDLSKALRRSLVAWRFKPQEIRLLLILCDETYDSLRLRAPADLCRWSLHLQMREDKLRNGPWKELCNLWVVDFNAGQGTYELRPNMANWCIRGARVLNNDDLRAGQELPLVAERPVSVAYTELCREKVLTEASANKGDRPCAPAPAGSQSSKDLSEDFKRLQIALSRGTVEQEFPAQSPDNSSVTPLTEKLSASGGKIRRVTAEKSAGMDPPGNSQVASTAEKSAAPIAKLSFDLKAKLAISPAEKSAAAFEFLQRLDKRGALNLTRCRSQWAGLCEKDPEYVLVKLGGAWQVTQGFDSDGRPIENPLAYVARKARSDHKLR